MSFNLSPDEISSFQNPKREYLPQVVIENPEFENSFKKLIADLEEMTSESTCQKRAERFKWPVPISAYAEKLLSNSNKRIIIAGIRFRNLNSEFPFVNFNLNYTPTESEVRELGILAKDSFPEFKLKGFTLKLKSDLDFQLPFSRWNHTLWGDLKKDRLSNADSMGVVWEDSVKFYAQYLQEYTQFTVDSPRMKEYLSVEAQEDLQTAANEKLLLSLYDEQGWCGVIGGKEKKYYGYKCLYIFEKFLTERVRGKGLAKNFEKNFLNNLAERYEHIFGHIVNENTASLKTALSAGRKPIETEYFFHL